MGFLVCHMQKHQEGAIKGIQYHNQRERESHTNRDIDHSKSDLNYDLINDKPISYTRAINQRIAKLQLKRAVRKDAVKLCSFIITSDHKTMDGFGGKEIEYLFKDSIKFFQNRYGKENVIFGQVHHDEATPHLHVGVVPIRDGKLSAKAIFNKHELKSLQTDLHRAVGVKYGLERGIEGSQAVRLTELEYKTQQEQLKWERLNERLTAYMTSGEIEKLNELEDTFKQRLNHHNKQINTIHKRNVDGVNAFENLKSPLFDNDSVIVSKQSYLNLLQNDADLVTLQEDLHALNGEMQALTSTIKERIENSPAFDYAEHQENIYKTTKHQRIGAMASVAYRHSRDFLNRHFDTLQKAVDTFVKPLHEGFGNFCKGFLSASLEDDDLEKALKVGIFSQNMGFDEAKAEFDLSETVDEFLGKQYEESYNQAEDFDFDEFELEFEKSRGISL